MTVRPDSARGRTQRREKRNELLCQRERCRMSRTAGNVTGRVAATVAYSVLFAFLLSFSWEVLQTPFYDDATNDVNVVVWYRVHCALGDIGILLGSMALGSGIRRSIRWVLSPSRQDLLLVTSFGVAYTIFSEYVNVRIIERWSYSPLMPTAAGIGLVPIAQWLLLPAVILKLAATHMRGMTSRP